ncbi:MAG: ECF transporter S component [Oscillospiraceae bacterium]|nr:ECF transporter S component [Oscillospiraceae bacterium]
MKVSQRNNTTQLLVKASMFSALVCVATMVIKIPSPLSGYINLGDSMVLIAGWMLPPAYGFLAAGMGSAMADIFSGYVFYAPATFIIKGVMAVIVNKCVQKLPSARYSKLIGGITAETVMVTGYLLFESMIYGFAASVVNVPANSVQGVGCLCIALITARIRDNHFSHMR